MKKSKKIIVTGCAGFIGFHLCKRLIDEKYDVYGIDCLNTYYDVNLKKDRLKILKKKENFSFSKIDISRKNSLKKFEPLKPDVFINLAAQAGVRHSLSHPEDYTKNNIDAFLTVLEFARNIALPHLVYASTSSVYGGNIKMPFSSSDSVDHPLQFYAATKRANELMAHAYSNLYNIPTTGLRFFTVYGPWGRPDMALFLFTKNIMEGKKIDVFNKGNHIRDFTYVEDIVDGIIRASKKIPKTNKNWDGKMDPSSSFAPFKIYNIGGNKPIQLMDYIKEIERNLNTKAKINFLPLQAGDVIETKSDISNLMEDVGYEPKTAIQEGVKEFVDWYRHYYAKKNNMKILSPFAVSCAAITSALLAFALQVFLSYNLTKSQFGIFIFLNALLNISITGGLFGVQHLWFSSLTSSLASHANQIRSSLIILLFVTICFYFIALFFGISTSQTSELMGGRLLFLLIFFTYIFGAVAWELVMLLLDIKQKFLISSFAKVMPHGIRLLIISFLLITLSDFKFIAIGNMIAGLILMVSSIIFLRKLIGLNLSFKISRLVIDFSQSYEIFKDSIPFFIHNILWIILMQLPILLSYIFLNEADLANTGVAFIILTGAMILPSNLISKYLYPKLSQSDNMYFFYKKTILWILSIAICFGVALIIISDFLILNLFPAIYIDSASILKIFGILIPFKIVTNYFSVFCILYKKIFQMNVIYAAIIVIQGLFFYLYSQFDQSFFIHFSFIISECILMLLLFYISLYKLSQSKLD